MSELLKSELAIERDKWMETHEGKACLDETERFLTMRQKIECAFMAGAIAEAAAQDEICRKLTDPFFKRLGN